MIALDTDRVAITHPTQDSLEIRIAVPETIPAVKIFLGFFAGISFLAPIVGAILLGSELRPGFIVGMLATFAVGFWFLRFLLWNTFGVEVFHFSPGEFSIVNDYKWFKAPRLKVGTAHLEVDYKIKETDTDELGFEVKEGLFLFKDGKKDIESSVKLSQRELESTVEIIRNYLESVNLDLTRIA
jgi:hypothetical protein